MKRNYICTLLFMVLSMSLPANAQNMSYKNILLLANTDRPSLVNEKMRSWGYALENTSDERDGVTTCMEWIFKNKTLDYSMDISINKKNKKVEYINWHFFGSQAFVNIRKEILANGWEFAFDEVCESGIETTYKHKTIKGSLSLSEGVPHRKGQMYTFGYCNEDDEEEGATSSSRIVTNANSIQSSPYSNDFSSPIIMTPPPPPPVPEPEPESYIDDNKVYDVVEQQPSFPGNINTWLASNLRYPSESAANGIEGRVIVQFVVSRDGSIYNAEVVCGVDSALDKEALRVVNSMPKWTPGKLSGKVVNCKYTLPVAFHLQ